jgi:hypothetical protein
LIVVTVSPTAVPSQVPSVLVDPQASKRSVDPVAVWGAIAVMVVMALVTAGGIGLALRSMIRGGSQG